MTRVTTLETGSAAGSGAPTRQDLGTYSDIVTVPASGSLGSSEDNRNAGRRLDTFSNPENERARSVVLLLFHVNNTTLEFLHAIDPFRKSPTYQTTIPSGFIAKQVVYPPLHWGQERNVSTLWLDTRMMVSLRS